MMAEREGAAAPLPSLNPGVGAMAARVWCSWSFGVGLGAKGKELKKEVVQGFGRLGNRLTDMWGHGRGFQMGRAQKQR